MSGRTPWWEVESASQRTALPWTSVHTLLEGEKCFRELARALPEPVWVVRSDGRLAYGNPCWHAQTALPEGNDFLTGHFALVHPEDRKRCIEVWESAQRTGSAYEVERRLYSARTDTYLRQVEHAYPVHDANRNVVEWVFIAIASADESRQIIEQLRRSLLSKDEALVAVAHEMRNPLAPIASALKLLERRGADPVCVAQMRALIERQLSQLARLVEDLLDLARIEQRQLGVRNERTDLRRVLAEAVETAQPIISARRHELAIAVLTDAAEIEGDAGRLTQVIVNLLVNGAKFTDCGGRILVSLEREGAAFVIRIRDTGIGIAREVLPQIFDPYVRVDRGGGTGLGLGLALARELAHLHGGTLTAHSDGVGKGSEFVLKLPASAAMPPADAV